MDRSHDLDTARGIIAGLGYSAIAWLVIAVLTLTWFEYGP